MSFNIKRTTNDSWVENAAILGIGGTLGCLIVVGFIALRFAVFAFLGWLSFLVYREVRADDWPWIHLWVWFIIWWLIGAFASMIRRGD